jgi:hypothetical protein
MNGRSAMSLARMRQLALIGSGWAIIGLGIVISPLPGPLGLPVAIIGGLILLRNSSDARRMFVRLKRRYPRILSPANALLSRLRRRHKARRNGG